MILSGQVERGSRLRQDALAEQFRTSITPVREALRVLESEGLVVAEPHRGVRVAAVDPARVETIYVLRRLAEAHAMERATDRLSPRDLREAARLAEDLERAAAQGDSQAVRELNRAFHFYFYERCGLPGLTEHIANLWNAFPWDLVLNAQERVDASAEEHRAILEAVSTGDPGAAAAATTDHIRAGYLAVMSHLGTETA